MKNEKLNYADAMQRLETIVNQLENGNLDIDSLADRLKEAQQLISFCKTKLTHVEKDVKKILSPEEQA